MDNNSTSEGWTYFQESWTLDLPLYEDIDSIWPTLDAPMEVDETNLMQQQIENSLSHPTNPLNIEFDPTLYGLQNDNLGTLNDSMLYNDPFLSTEFYHGQSEVNTKDNIDNNLLSASEPVLIGNSFLSVPVNSVQPPVKYITSDQRDENKGLMSSQGPTPCGDPPSVTQPTYKEDSLLATSINPNVFQFGDLTCTIIENDHVRLSLGSGYHIIREQGNLNIKIRTTRLNGHPSRCFIRATLVRKNPDQRQKVINHICQKHENANDPHLWQHVMQTTLDPSLSWYDNSAPQKSVNFWLQESLNTETLEAIISLKFACTTSCEVTSPKQDMLSCPERGREWILILTAECLDSQKVFARRIIEVWPKASINARDLYKQERLQPKGIRGRSKSKGNQARLKAKINQKVCHLVDIAKNCNISKDEVISVINSQWEKINTLPVKQIY